MERKVDSRANITENGIIIKKKKSISNAVKERYYKTETFPRIVERVKYLKIHKRGMDIMCEVADKIREEGKSVGRLESRIEDILKLLEELGQVPQRITEHIRAEDNLSVLS